MGFNNLAEGNPFYILRRGEKPTLEVGVVKSKTDPKPMYQTQTPNILAGLNNLQQVVTVVATINGRDETFADLPTNVEIAAKGNDTFSGSREAMLQAVDAMLQTSKKALEQVDYHKGVLAEGEKMLETLNPKYAEEKAQARTIRALEERQTKTDAKLDSILELLRKMDVPAKVKPQ